MFEAVQSLCVLPGLFFNHKLQRCKTRKVSIAAVRKCGAHIACHSQASNPLDMTKLFFFTVVRCVLSHQTNAAYVNIGIIAEVYIQYTTIGLRPHVFPITLRHCQYAIMVFRILLSI
jgi:hypothetical protein